MPDSTTPAPAWAAESIIWPRCESGQAFDPIRQLGRIPALVLVRAPHRVSRAYGRHHGARGALSRLLPASHARTTRGARFRTQRVSENSQCGGSRLAHDVRG